MSLILLIILLLFLVGGLPNWGYHKFGFAPSGIAGVVLLFVVFLLLDRPALKGRNMLAKLKQF